MWNNSNEKDKTTIKLGAIKYQDSDNSIYLFGMNKAGAKELWIGKIYEVWISKGDKDFMHLIPCQKDDGVQGMFDMLSHNFFPLVDKNSNTIIDAQ